MKKSKMVNLGILFILIVLISVLNGFGKIIVSFLTLLWGYYLFFKNRYIMYAIIGNKYFTKNEYELSKSWFKKAVAVKTCSPNVKISYSYILLRTGDLEDARKVIEDVMTSKLDSKTKNLAKQNCSLILYKSGKLKEAIEIMEEVYHDYKNTTVYGSLGFLYIEDGDYNKALEFNLKAMDYNQNDTIILDNLGQNYYLLENYDEAMNIYKKLMTLKPEFPDAHYNYGLVLERKGLKDEALEEFKKSLNYRFSFLSSVKKEEVEEKILNFK